MTGTTAPVPPAEPALTLDNVAFAWPGGAASTLDVPRLVLDRGAHTLLLGRSGSGKTTLLSLICGIVTPQRGNVRVDGVDMAALRPAARDRVRAERIGVIFQQFNLLPYASALDNILLALRFARERRRRAERHRDAAAEARRLGAALGLGDDVFAARRAATLSVGQQQRVAAARAMIGAPPLIVADEPTSALDADSQAAFLDLLFAQCAEAGATLLMVSHDARLGAHFERVVDIADLTRPATERAA